MRRPQPIYPLCISLVALNWEGDSSILVHLQRTIVVGTEEICLLKLHDTHLEVAAQVLFMSLLLPRRPGTEVERGVRRGSGCGRRLGSRTSVRACFCCSQTLHYEHCKRVATRLSLSFIIKTQPVLYCVCFFRKRLRQENLDKVSLVITQHRNIHLSIPRARVFVSVCVSTP